jgi:hypothetical protein
MKWNYTLSWIALSYILINILFAADMVNSTGGTGLIYVLIFPAFWIFAAIGIGILSYKKRSSWFQNKMKFSTILLLFLCTPLLPLAYSNLSEPKIARSGTDYFTENGRSYRRECYVYYDNNEPARIELWAKDTGSNSIYAEDSNWIYFDRNGDTLKILMYDNSVLVKEVNY